MAAPPSILLLQSNKAKVQQENALITYWQHTHKNMTHVKHAESQEQGGATEKEAIFEYWGEAVHGAQVKE